MNLTATAHTRLSESRLAGQDLGEAIAQQLGGRRPDVVIAFASPRHDFGDFLSALDQSCSPKLLTGCSSAGEFTGNDNGDGSASALAIRSDEMQFSIGMGRRISTDRVQAAHQMLSTLASSREIGFSHRYAMILTASVGGHIEDLMEQLVRESHGSHHFFGGGAGDDARFQETHVFFGKWAYTDAAILLEILSNKPLGIGAHHGWRPASGLMTVDVARGSVVERINGRTALEVFVEYAQRTGQQFDTANPMPFFLHNCVGIESPEGHKIRVPLEILPNGCVAFAAEIPEGSRIALMQTTAASAADAAREAARSALEQIGSSRPGASLFFDCAATRLRIGQEFGLELAAVSEALGSAPMAGCNTYGQIVSAPGQFNGFHNCTAVTCVFPA